MLHRRMLCNAAVEVLCSRSRRLYRSWEAHSGYTAGCIRRI